MLREISIISGLLLALHPSSVHSSRACSAPGSESEGSLTCLEAVTAHSCEENEVPVSSGRHRMSEGKDCGGGDALSNGIKKHRYGASDSSRPSSAQNSALKANAVLCFLPSTGCLCCSMCHLQGRIGSTISLFLVLQGQSLALAPRLSGSV